MINVVGLVLLAVLYTVILVLGIVAARCFKLGDGPRSELALVAGRKLGPCIGIFTMTATVVGGGYLNGTAEAMFMSGLAWTIAPFCIFLGLVIGGLVYAKRMRDECYVTMLDPLQERYGPAVTVLIYLASLCGDIFWTSSILIALGTSVSVVVNLDVTIAIIASAAVTTCYTLIGQMVSVAFTDIAELVLITIGLAVSLPFVLTNEKTGDVLGSAELWQGNISKADIGAWIDLFVAMTFGTIPWQSYFQRVLSVKTSQDARILSVGGACWGLVLAFPSYAIGAVATVSDWTNTSIGAYPEDSYQTSVILPLVISEFTPTPVALVGLTAVCAAVMSSMDSSILGSSSMFTHNIFKNIIYQKASDRLLLWIQRTAVLVIGTLATVIALKITSVYGLFILAADIVFVSVLPQLTCAIYLKFTNAYGALAGYIVGLVLRLGSGEHFVSLPPIIKYPFYDSEHDMQRFPYRIFAIICSFLAIILVSLVTNVLCIRFPLTSLDVLGVVERRTMRPVTVLRVHEKRSEEESFEQAFDISSGPL